MHTASPVSEPVPAPSAQPEAPDPAPARPAAPLPRPSTAAVTPAAAQTTWQVVEQKPFEVDITKSEPTAEDRSYAEWFVWAKRGGAPASACHAAAQGAFRALAAGHDVKVAVEWATTAMASPPLVVEHVRSSYCAWYSLANIELEYEPFRAHPFALAAIRASNSGADAKAAHQAGVAAAVVKPPS